jgi:isoamylase
MLATLLLSQGTPMILAGRRDRQQPRRQQQRLLPGQRDRLDRLGAADHDFLAFTRRLIAFRKAHPILRQNRFLHARERAHRRHGGPVLVARGRRVLCAELRMASGTPVYGEREDAIFLAFNASHEDVAVMLPEPPEGMRWSQQISTATAWFGRRAAGETLDVPGPSIVVCVLEPERE